MRDQLPCQHDGRNDCIKDFSKLQLLNGENGISRMQLGTKERNFRNANGPGFQKEVAL